MQLLYDFCLAFWNMLVLAAPYVLFGFFVAGLLKAFLPPSFVTRHLGQGRYAPVFKAALFGIPLPLCSCGVVPTAAELRRQGASKGATAAFMISTPETGVDSIAVTWAMLDPLMALLRPLTALITAVTAGILTNRFDADIKAPHTAGFVRPHLDTLSSALHSDAPCACAHHEHVHDDNVSHSAQHNGSVSAAPAGLFARFTLGMRYAFGELIADIGLWLLIGISIAALIELFVPADMLLESVGHGFGSMLLMLALGVPMYVCATASTPIAAALALKGLSPGAALVFLLVGPATNVATITVVTKMLGKRAAFIYVASISICALILGMLTNQLYALLGLDVAAWVQKPLNEENALAGILSALILIVLVLWQAIRALLRKEPACACGTHS